MYRVVEVRGNFRATTGIARKKYVATYVAFVTTDMKLRSCILHDCYLSADYLKKRLYGGFDASVIDTNIYKYIIIIMIPYSRKYVKHRTGFFTPTTSGPNGAHPHTSAPFVWEIVILGCKKQKCVL